jgi:threonine synthase
MRCPRGCGELPDGKGTCRCGAVVLHPLRAPPANTGHARTPLLRSRLVPGAYWKVEGANVTGTFKDRVMEALVRDAVAGDAPGAVVASSGNAAVAAAHACRREDLPLLALVPSATPTIKLAPLRLRGVPVVAIDGDPSTAYAAAGALAQEFGLTELPSTFKASGTELACRSIGHEVVAQLEGTPVAVSAAISVGPVLVGTANGIQEAASAPPAMLGAQASGCAPIARAFTAGDDKVLPWEEPIATSAGSIADRLTGYAHEGTFTAAATRASGGWVRAWSDADLHRARRELAELDGLDVELASAAAVLAAQAWDGDGPVVGVLTGNGIRDTLEGVDVPTDPAPLDDFTARAGIDDVLEVLAPWTR